MATDGLPRLTKAGALFRLAWRDPVEFFDRVRAIGEVTARRVWPTRTRYAVSTWDAVAAGLERTCPGVSVDRAGTEFEQVYGELRRRRMTVLDAPFPTVFDADPVLARAAYVLTRTLQPSLVVETGVALGVTSTCILAALERNGRGRLLSIELPPLGVTRTWVGRMVPDELRARWTLLYGASARLLPAALAEAAPVGLFVADSLFTRRNSMQEYRHVRPRLAPLSAVVANAVEHSDAFQWLRAYSQPFVASVLPAATKPGELIGVCLYAADQRASSSDGLPIRRAQMTKSSAILQDARSRTGRE